MHWRLVGDHGFHYGDGRHGRIAQLLSCDLLKVFNDRLARWIVVGD